MNIADRRARIADKPLNIADRRARIADKPSNITAKSVRNNGKPNHIFENCVKFYTKFFNPDFGFLYFPAYVRFRPN